MDGKKYSKTDVLVVGAAPAGLACAIAAKKQNPNLDVCVIDKSAIPGGHNLSGATLEPQAIHNLLNMTVKDWQQAPIVHDVLSRKVFKDEVFLLSEKKHTRLTALMKFAKKLHLAAGDILSGGDYIVSISKLTRLLACIAKNLGVELLFGFAADEVVVDGNIATGVKLLDSGVDSEGNHLENYLEGEFIQADYIILAEGCDGFATEKFVAQTGLMRKQPPIFSIGVKEIIEVSEQQYKAFGDNTAMHFPGYPLWMPFRNPSIFGGGVMYSMGSNKIAVAMIAALDWQYSDFSAQKALALLKEHPFVNRYITDGKVVEDGAKMIPEGGFYSIPTEPNTGTIGKNNVVIIGDAASLVNMRKLKGIGNAINSGLSAGFAIANAESKISFAAEYTDMLRTNGLLSSMKKAAKYRQVISLFGMNIGLFLSNFAAFLPFIKANPDSTKMKNQRYGLEPQEPIDKSLFVYRAGSSHKEQQKNHISIKDLDVCKWDCMRTYDCPCVTFCPAGVYERVQEHIQPLNFTNCLHCKSCQDKCPYDNIYWSMPEAGEGPKYQNL